ncbi:MAG: QueT transporter family protein [Veillonellaceae bacterium]|nr:QueT transporter family protein [Veillonellaceae bacterium]
MNTRTLVINALIAAVYAALTIALAPLSYGPIQVRLSECMTLLAFADRRRVAGLTVGCLLANLASPFGLVDIVIGTLATCIAVYGMRYTKNIFVAALLPVASNGIIIALELAYLGELPPELSLFAMMAYIAAGELVSTVIIGIPLLRLALRNTVIRKALTE